MNEIRLDKTEERLIRLETKIDMLFQLLEKYTENIKDHEERLRDLERNHWKIATLSGTVGAAAGFIAGVAKHIFLR